MDKPKDCLENRKLIHNKIYLVFFGDVISSWHALLKFKIVCGEKKLKIGNLFKRHFY